MAASTGPPYGYLIGFLAHALFKKATCIPMIWSHAVSSSIDFGRILKRTDVVFWALPAPHPAVLVWLGQFIITF